MKKQVLLIIIILALIGIAIFILTPKKYGDVKVANVASTSSSSFMLEPQQITLENDETFALNIPSSYDIAVAGEELGRARFMAKSPDGRLFVTDMRNLSDNSDGKIYVLSNFNQTSKKFENKITYLSGLRNPNSVAFYSDGNGIDWLYIALTDKLVRYKYTQGETSPTSEPETLATFPDYGLSYKYGGWHLTRTVVIHNNKVYVSVGSSCNACEEKEEIRAAIVEMNPDGSDQKVIAKGLRNAVGMVSVGKDLYVSNMGSDHLGDDRPEETFYKLSFGTNYGWPYCYQYQNSIFEDISQRWNTPIDCSKVPLAMATFPAHAAPLGVEYFDNGFLTALHGSSDVSRARGYSIVYHDQSGIVEDFITGFLQNGTRYGRPAGILVDSDSSFFFTDDFGGILYYVYKK